MKSSISRKILLALGLGLSWVLLSGCIPSLYPLYNEADLIYEPGLEGNWLSADSSQIWTFSQKTQVVYSGTYLGTSTDSVSQKYYHLVIGQIKEGTITDTLEARLGKLGNQYYLDLTPDMEALNLNKEGITALHLIPGHTFYPMDWDGGDQFKLYALNPDVLEKGIKDKKYSLKLEEIDSRPLLMSPTSQLQKFILAHGRDTTLFPPSDSFYKKP